MAEILNDSQYAEWDEFVRQAEGGTIFHTSWYLLSLLENIEVRVLRDTTGKIEAGLVICPSRFLGASTTRARGLAPYNGPVVRRAQGPTDLDRRSDHKELLLHLLAESPSLGMYDYNLPPEYADMMPFLWNGFDVLAEYTYQIPPEPVEAWQAKMSQNQKKNLRRARNALKELNATLEVNGDAEEFYGMILDLAKVDKFVHCHEREQFLRWWKCMREHDAATLLVIRDGEGTPLVGNLAVQDWRCSYDLLAGVRGGRLSGPGGYVHRLIFERMILDAHQRGLIFDFGGTILPGVEPYVRRWGGHCLPHFRVVKIRNPLTYALWALYRYWKRHRNRTWFSH